MKLIVDEDVAKVAEFMRLNIDAIKLQRVARALVQLGELIWPEQYPEDRYLAFRQEISPLERAADSPQQPVAKLLDHTEGRDIQGHDRNNGL
ncbi:hypothetical protein [Candidatus Binatus sp.]